MAVDLTVPQLGESISEAVVGKWHKKVGESVTADEPLVALETDKVTVDVPAPAGGALAQITRKEGDRVKVGEVLGSISPGESVPARAPITAAPESVPARAPTAARESVPAGTPTAARDGQPQPVQRSPERSAGDGRGALLTPVARRVAEDNSLDPSQIRGSGSGGRIVKDDVLQLLGGTAETLRKAPAKPTSPAPRPDGQREERVRMT
ncbi:MAG TPA: biotin/lipoyl-containing protein, partial [Myxococcales bacterium]